MTRKIRVTQKRNGKKITFLTEDKGKPGKTPKEEQWYEPGVHTGWEKVLPESERRVRVLSAHGGDELASGRSMMAKANVTTDRETEQKARADAKYFFRLHKEIRRIAPHRRPVRVAKPSTPRVELQRIHSRRSPLSQAIDEGQSHQVTLSPDSPKVEAWKTDPGRADVRGIDTPRLKGKTPRITPKRPKLRR